MVAIIKHYSGKIFDYVEENGLFDGNKGPLIAIGKTALTIYTLMPWKLPIDIFGINSGIKEQIISKCCQFVLGSNNSYDSNGLATREFTNCFANVNQMFLDHDYKIFIAGAVILGHYFYHSERKLDRIRQVANVNIICLRLATLKYRNRTIMRGNRHFLESVYHRKTKVVRAYLDAGMSPNETNSMGVTALMLSLGYVAYHGRLSATLILLIKAGANVNQQDIRGTSALMRAASSGSVPSIRYLLRSGASVTQKDDMGANALMYARRSNEQEAEMEITKVMCIPFVAEQFLADINHDLVSRLGGRAHNYDTTRQVAKIVRSYL